jgi:hypothetical protein
VADKFGAGTIERASLLGRKERRHPEAGQDSRPKRNRTSD